MNARLALSILGLAGALCLTPGIADAQSEPEQKPDRGKVDGVEDEARRARHEGDDTGGCDDCGGGFFLFQMVDATFRALFAPSPHPGQGYQRYPYATPDGEDPFVLETVTTGRRFGTMSGTYFNDRAVGGTLESGQFVLEGVNGIFLSGIEYALYREPTQVDTDWLHLARVGLGVVPRLGRMGFARLTVAARAVILDNGDAAIGPEVELGVQAFPVRPWGVSANARGALLEWNWGGSSPFTNLTANGSYFLGRVEVMAGWRYTKVGSAAAFNGPTAGIRLWF